MQTKAHKSLKILISGLAIFLVIYSIDNIFFYENNYRGGHALLTVFFAPILLLATVLRLSDYIFYRTLLFPQWDDSTIFIIGISWSIVLAYIFFKVKSTKSSLLRGIIFILISITIIGVSHLAATALFGHGFYRICPECP